MKNRILLSTLLLISATKIFGNWHYSNQSMFSIRTPFQTASPEKEALWHYDWLYNTDDWGGSIELVPFGGRTFGDTLGAFFCPHGTTTLDVREYKASVPSSTNDLNAHKDIEARHFNIETRSQDTVFHSKVCIKPVHEFFGFGIAWRQKINDCWWFDISGPVERVRNKIEVKETILSDGGGAAEKTGLDGLPRAGSMTEALDSSLLQFGRIEPNRCHEKVGFADLEVRLGWNTYDNGDAHLRSYIGGVFPTGNKPDARYLFAPVIGNNKHYGVMFGNNIGFCLWQIGEHRLRQEIDTMGRYLFPNYQVRSFDLIDKEWGRYQEVYANVDDAQQAFSEGNPNSGTNGINVFTARTKVQPRFSTTFNTAVIYEYCDWLTAEGGYNFYARQAESVELCKFNPKMALKHIDGEGLTTRSRTISENFVGDSIEFADYTSIDRSILDLCSAAHPPAILQTLYGALGYKCPNFWLPTIFSVGGSYEFSHINSGLRKWMVWGKVSFDF